MTSNQVEWAKQHDWYKGTITINGSVHVKGSVLVTKGGDVVGVDCITTDNFKELRAWAGY